MNRGTYGQIKMETLDVELAQAVRAMVANAANAQKVDEHGNWEFGIEMDGKGRGSALNWDLYAVGNDYHNGGLLIVIQVRQFVRQRKNWYPEIRKSYFLIGTNEDGTTFAHPVQSQVIHHAIKKDRDVIMAVQTWIFGVDYTQVVRQGDVALIPMKRTPPANRVDYTAATLQDSHWVTADEMRANGNLYALNPHITHLPGTHPAYELAGWWKVVPGKRADFYEFAAPTID